MTELQRLKLAEITIYIMCKLQQCPTKHSTRPSGRLLGILVAVVLHIVVLDTNMQKVVLLVIHMGT
jgi:hypothetical protein